MNAPLDRRPNLPTKVTIEPRVRSLISASNSSREACVRVSAVGKSHRVLEILSGVSASRRWRWRGANTAEKCRWAAIEKIYDIQLLFIHVSPHKQGVAPVCCPYQKIYIRSVVAVAEPELAVSGAVSTRISV